MNYQMAVILGCVAIAGCSSPQFDETHALVGAQAMACTTADQPLWQPCEGRSVILTGFTIDNAPKGYRLSVENPANGKDPGASDDFIAVYEEDYRRLEGKVQVKGVVEGRGFFTLKPVVLISEVTSAPLTRREAMLLAQRQREGNKSPEERIAEARREGARALEEWDAAIRANNDALRSAVAAKAIAHTTRVSNDLRVDSYGMPDGRWIHCKTVIYSTGAPITTCDGEP